MNIFNRSIAKTILDTYCAVVTGDKGAGKSTLFALIIDVARKQGLDVYCQFPYQDCYQIPLIKTTRDGVDVYDVDKNWLYSHDLSNAVVLIDEGKTVWPARAFKSWTLADEQFFNFLRHNNTRLFIATQAYDGLDLNVRRASDIVMYLTLGFWHFTHIETSHTTLCKVADKQTEVQGRMFKKGMRKIAWDVCEVPLKNYHFWRKPYYNKFFSHFMFGEKPAPEKHNWSNVINFETGESILVS